MGAGAFSEPCPIPLCGPGHAAQSPHPVNGVMETVPASRGSRERAMTSGGSLWGLEIQVLVQSWGRSPRPRLQVTRQLSGVSRRPGTCPVALRSCRLLLHFQLAPWGSIAELSDDGLGPGWPPSGRGPQSPAQPRQYDTWVGRTRAKDGDPTPGLSRAGRACCTAG